MTQQSIELLTERVATLEAAVSQLQRSHNRSRSKDWRKTIGMFAGDEMMQEIFEAGRQIREADRAESRE